MAKKGLGRGLSALIPKKENQLKDQNRILTLSISKIRPNPNQPRKTFEKRICVINVKILFLKTYYVVDFSR